MQNKDFGKRLYEQKESGDNPLKTVKRTAIRESDIGVYVWERSNGKILANQDGDVLNIQSEYGDVRKMIELQKAAEYWCKKEGIDPGGKAIFWESHRCTEEEYLQQVYDMENGIVPDTKIRRQR